ncbi:MAG: hypothetical protein ACRDGF_00945 [Chloroflexota bacterium]
MVAVYDDGALYATPALDVARFTTAGKRLIHITATGETLTAQFGDVENGDLDEPGARDWRSRQAAARLAQGGVYGSLSRLGAVVAVCGRVPLWAAHYTYSAHVCSEACRADAPNLPADFDWSLIVGTQYADHGPNGEHYDMSLMTPTPPS